MTQPHAWAPGDVALVECSDGEWRQAVCEPHGSIADLLVWRFPDRVHRYVENGPARPLVVIDPEDTGRVAQLTSSFIDESQTLMAWQVTHMASALRGLLPAPAPEVFSHLARSEGDFLYQFLCGKVWEPERGVTVKGRCPECAALAETGWIA